jgi:hypothetical protein
LPGRAEDARQRRAHGEEVERRAGRESRQARRPGELGCEHAIEPVGALADHRRIVEHARGVHHAAQRRQLRAQRIPSRDQRVAVGDVGGDGAHRDAALGELGELSRLVVGRCRPADQDEVPDPTRDPRLRDRPSDRAQAARDQVGRVAAQRARCPVTAQRGEPGAEHRVPADRDLIVGTVDRIDRPGDTAGISRVEIDQAAPQLG